MLLANKKKYLIILIILIGIIFLLNDRFFNKNNESNQILFDVSTNKQVQIKKPALGSIMAATGVFDVFTKNDSTLRIAGWAVNNDRTLPAKKIHIFYKEQYIGSAKVYIERPGVAKISKSGKSLIKSGFNFSILNFPKDIDACKLDFIAEINPKSLQKMANNKCKSLSGIN